MESPRPPTGLHARNASNASSVGDDTWTGFAGAAPAEDQPEGEERMSVSAALQRFRRMERLSKEQRALAEQQQAVLDAQRQQALTHRHSAGGSGAGSPSARGPQPLNMAAWTDRVSIVKDSIPYPSAQRLAVEAQHPHTPAPVSPTGNVWRRTSLEGPGSGDGSSGSRYRRSFSARSSTGGSSVVRGSRSVSAGPNMSDHATVRAAMSSDSVQAAISAASTPESPRSTCSSPASSPLRSGSQQASQSPEGPTRLSVQSSPQTPDPAAELDEPSAPEEADFGDFNTADSPAGGPASSSAAPVATMEPPADSADHGREAGPASSGEAPVTEPDPVAGSPDSSPEAEPASSSVAPAPGTEPSVDSPVSSPEAAEVSSSAGPVAESEPGAGGPDEASIAAAAADMQAEAIASTPSGDSDGFGDFEDAPAGAAAASPLSEQLSPLQQPAEEPDEAPAQPQAGDELVSTASADESDDDFGDFDQAEAAPTPPPADSQAAEPEQAAKPQPAAPAIKLAPPAAVSRMQPTVAPTTAALPPPPAQLPRSKALEAAQAAAADKGGATGSILDLGHADFRSAVAAILAEGAFAGQRVGDVDARAGGTLLTLADLLGEQPAPDAPAERVTPIPWRSSQAEEQLLQQLGLQQAAADAAARQRTTAASRTLRRRSSTIAQQRAMAQEAAALQRPGSAASSGPGLASVSHSGSASDFGSFTGGPRPPSGGPSGGGGGDPFTASGELGFEFVDPPAGFEAGASASDYVKVPPRPAMPRVPLKPPPVFRSLAGDGKAAPKRRLSKFGTPDVEQPAAPQVRLAPPPPPSASRAVVDSFRSTRGEGPPAPASVDPFAAMGQHDLALQSGLSAAAPAAVQQGTPAAGAGSNDDDDDDGFSTFQSAEELQAAERASDAAREEASQPGTSAAAPATVPAEEPAGPGSAAQGGQGAPTPVADPAVIVADAVAAPQQPQPSGLTALQELVPQEADDSWLSDQTAGNAPAGEQLAAVDAAAAPSLEAAAEKASGSVVPTADAQDAAGPPPPAAQPQSAGAPPVTAAADDNEDADDDEFVWSAPEPAAPAPEPAAPKDVQPPQPAAAPAQQQQQQLKEQPPLQPAHVVAQPPTHVPHGFTLSLPKPPPGRQPRDVFATIGAAPGKGSADPPVDVFAAQQPLFSSAVQPAPQTEPAMLGDSDDDFGDFAAADANGMAAEQQQPPQQTGTSDPVPSGADAPEQPALNAEAADGEEDEFGDFEASATAADAAAPNGAGEEAAADVQEHADLATEPKEPEPEKDPFADLF